MRRRPKIFITGASGFVGSALLATIDSAAVKVDVKLGLKDVSGSELNYETVKLDLAEKICVDLKNIDVVVHLAGVAHNRSTPTESYDLINHKATLSLAKIASDHGVKRFIFLSSIGVNGKTSSVTDPFTRYSIPAPHNDYSQSKYDAELGLIELAKSSSMEVVIIRPPLIYGNEAPGNFSKLVKLVRFRIPFPLTAADNKRSFIGITNLCNFICKLIDMKIVGLAQIEIFLVSDAELISTAQLVSAIGLSRCKRVVDIPLSRNFLVSLMFFLGLNKLKESLLDDLVIDSTYARRKINCDPDISVLKELNKGR